MAKKEETIQEESVMIPEVTYSEESPQMYFYSSAPAPPISNLIKALNAVTSQANKVVKSGYNSFQKYKYMTETDVIDCLRPLLEEHGLQLIPSLEGSPIVDENGNTNIIMSYTLAHISGETMTVRFAGCGNDMNSSGRIGDKGLYKAYTGANKYALSKLFQIATGDDPENEDVVHANPGSNKLSSDLNSLSKKLG